jgi:hypothetical protein
MNEAEDRLKKALDKLGIPYSMFEPSDNQDDFEIHNPDGSTEGVNIYGKYHIPTIEETASIMQSGFLEDQKKVNSPEFQKIYKRLKALQTKVKRRMLAIPRRVSRKPGYLRERAIMNYRVLRARWIYRVKP